MSNEICDIANANFFSEQLSKISRQINFAVLAIAWGVIVVSQDSRIYLFTIDKILPVISISLISLIFDFSQYFLGYVNLRFFGAHNKLVAIHECLFFLKLLLTIVACAWLIVLCAKTAFG
jgi:hypothetical protein